MDDVEIFREVHPETGDISVIRINIETDGCFILILTIIDQGLDNYQLSDIRCAACLNRLMSISFLSMTYDLNSVTRGRLLRSM